jgi:DNA polymerase III subunit delta
MAQDLQPEDVFQALDKGVLAPFYLFFGPDEFMIERVISRIREEYIPEGSRDFNLEICYGGETEPSEIVSRAQTMPFMSKNRLIIVRRAEEFKADQLERFSGYLDNPATSTCLIFLTSKTDFKTKFFKKIRSSGLAVDFKELKSNQVAPWIKRMARELGLNIGVQACIYLQNVVGDRLRDLYTELVKLQIRYGKSEIGEKEIRELAIHGRTYNIFELMDALAVKDKGRSLSVLNRFLEEEDKKSAPLQIIGMLNRQIGMLWRTKVIVESGGKSEDVASKLGLHSFQAGNFMKQSRHWSVEELEKGISLLYRADRLIKLGSRPGPVLEGLVISLCGYLDES